MVLSPSSQEVDQAGAAGQLDLAGEVGQQVLDGAAILAQEKHQDMGVGAPQELFQLQEVNHQ